MALSALTDRLFPAVTDRDIGFGGIRYYAQGGVTCYVIKGSRGGLLIDTGLPQVWPGLRRWLGGYDVRCVLLTHAHADHDWNAAKLRRAGKILLLNERDKTLRRHFMSQRVKPTSPRYAFRNFTQWINGSLFRSPPYDADIYFGSHDRGLLRELGFDADIIPLPGHTYGSAGVLSGGVLYCGDAFTGLWKRPDITPHAVSPRLMRRSLERIVRLSPEWLACGHGLPIRFDKALPVIESYLQSPGTER